ncbi:MAG: hypothetical protein GF311_18760 [Candidatus Lokiarchaeota archaeon]|nr:hypothetical protein [Candidatus Lokiarchaeota archaeon]
MSEKQINDLLWREKLRKKILKLKEKYHPRLVTNLSKEAHDRYIIRDSICSQILPLLDNTEKSMDDIHQLIIKKIKERENKLTSVKNKADFELIEIAIEEWKSFL